ncbi:MAG: hypothetical protein U0905_11960 [Pirellulales bacterium]
MKDPMAGNGKQLRQRFAWRKKPVEKVQESKADQIKEVAAGNRWRGIPVASTSLWLEALTGWKLKRWIV